MSPPDPVPTSIQKPAIWVGLEEQAVPAANAFTCQLVGPNELVLNIGHVMPPLTMGTPEEQQAQMQALPFVQVRGLARFALTQHRAEELIKALQDMVNSHKTAFQQGAS